MTDPVQDGAVRREAVARKLAEIYGKHAADPREREPAACDYEAADAIFALSQPNATTSEMVAVPAGWKLVPVEPTEAMVKAVWRETLVGGILSAERAARALLAASPVAEQADTAPSIEGGEK